MALQTFRDPAPAAAAPEQASSDIGARSGLLGVEIADLAGVIGELAKLGETQTACSRAAESAAAQMAESNAALIASMQTARISAHETQENLAARADEFSLAIAETSEKIGVLGDGATALRQAIEEVSATINAVSNAGAEIKKFTYDTQLLALNARIEAAHAGNAGAGFSVIAAGVEQLAENIRQATAQNQKHLESLTRTLATLTARAQSNAEIAQVAKAKSERSKQTVRSFRVMVETIQRLMSDIEAMSQSVEDNDRNYGALREEIAGLMTAVEAGNTHLETANGKAETILEISEEFILFIAESGIRTSDSPIIELCKRTAAQIAAIFEAAIAAGEISLADLFDRNYVPIPGTNPQQVMTKFVALTDAKLTPVQEQVLAADPRFLFAVSISYDGYIPTHNRMCSKPQGRDPVWNAANCRNRRLYDERTTLASCRNERPFLLKTLRRDMGGGNFMMMKVVTAPISVRGRHWGGFGIGFRV